MEISRRSFVAGSFAGFGLVTSVAPLRPPAASHPSSVGQSDLAYLGIRDAAELIRTRRLSPVELTRALLDRIDRIEPKVHAFITVASDEALDAARTAEAEIARGKYRGLLHGIPFGVKDTHYTKGIRTTAGTPVLSDFVPTFDATVVARLKAAGAILVGKTNLPEFSFGSALRDEGAASVSAALGSGVPRNPWDLSRTPGGSSSGSAIALAAGMLPATTGGDTSGSIRSPSSLCGVVGMKPTYGRVSRYGITAISWSLDHVGPMTRTVGDNALLLGVIAGYDPEDDTSAREPVPDYLRALGRSVRGMRIGVPPGAMLEGYHADIITAFEHASGLFKKLGARVAEAQMPRSAGVVDETQRIIRISEAASYHEQFLATRADRYGPTNVKSDIHAGSLITAVQYLRMQKLRKVFVRDMRDLFRRIDVLVMPGMAAPAGVPASAEHGFTRMFNVCGFPALALPAGFSSSPPGLPLALQLAAGPFEEEKIYAVAHAYETATRWYERRPNI